MVTGCHDLGGSGPSWSFETELEPIGAEKSIRDGVLTVPLPHKGRLVQGAPACFMSCPWCADSQAIAGKIKVFLTELSTSYLMLLDV